ncbi:unnamed protein product [Bursaphelenchus okinawaensis]|uniref:Uncharacterized protein n=1 Tax=Bursaphelenchus okinawaensis TaxID=465554 RepID=A0A811KNC5_9BILA|nr:unnamed protein product [Bursaphelenchus okinawaensis]CAG9107176.1 unnamed protein product [Bursaphelenchus okinawaensis]
MLQPSLLQLKRYSHRYFDSNATIITTSNFSSLICAHSGVAATEVMNIIFITISYSLDMIIRRAHKLQPPLLQLQC